MYYILIHQTSRIASDGRTGTGDRNNTSAEEAEG